MGNVFQMHNRKKSTADSELQLGEALEKLMNDFKGSKEDFLCMVADWLDQQAGYS
jgi:hypothetical protein